MARLLAKVGEYNALCICKGLSQKVCKRSSVAVGEQITEMGTQGNKHNDNHISGNTEEVVATKKIETKLTFDGLKWKKGMEEINKALVNNEVSLFCEVKNINDGEKIKLKIFEHGEDKDDPIDEIEVAVVGGMVEANWKVLYKEDDDSNTTKEIVENGFTTPDYYFVAEYGKVQSGRSKILYVEDWIDKQIIYDRTEKTAAKKKYTIVLLNGKKITGVTDDNGRVKETGFSISEAYLYLNEEDDA